MDGRNTRGIVISIMAFFKQESEMKLVSLHHEEHLSCEFFIIEFIIMILFKTEFALKCAW